METMEVRNIYRMTGLYIWYLAISVVAAEYCKMGDYCYPSNSQISTFDSNLEGSVHLKGTDDNFYDKIVIMKNTRVTKYPDMIVVVKSATDVKESILFARQHNLKVVIQSSGHDFQGRSTADNSFMIYLGNMTNIEVKTAKTDRAAAGEIVLDSGTQWVDIYRVVNNHDRVVVGGSAHTVAVGGWTLGGGHSPISGMVGLGVDSLLEVTMVTADGRIVVADGSSTEITYPNGTSETTSDSDIFWALSGGGGGTYGIVTQFTFKLHFPPNSMVKFSCDYPIIHENGTRVGNNILRAYADLVPNMPPEWGGYLIMSSIAKSVTNYLYKDGSAGSILLVLNHFGDYQSPTRSYMDSMYNLGGMARFCVYENISNFWEYEQNITDTIYQRNVIIGTLMQANSFTDDWVDYVINFVLRAYYQEWVAVTSFTGILLGGQVMNVSSAATSVHPAWRSSVMSTAFGFGWGNTDGDKHDQDVLNYVNSYQTKLYTFGEGMYPNEAGGNVPNFQNHFWGTNYPRLLEIKKKWDPENVFTCLECVGYKANTATLKGLSSWIIFVLFSVSVMIY